MAAQKIYTVYKATWASQAAGKTEVTVESITDMAANIAGSEGLFYADGNVYPTFGWMENVKESVQLTIADFSLIAGANSMAVNDPGLLTIQFPHRLPGKQGRDTGESLALQAVCGGPVASQDHGCTIMSINPSGKQQGAGSMNIGFALSSFDGVSSTIALTMATLIA